jgi:hypothetical protein
MYYDKTKIVFEGRWRENERDGEGIEYKPDGRSKKG